MNPRVDPELRALVERLQRDVSKGGDAFDLVLRLSEFVAGRESRIHAGDFDPESVLRRLVADREIVGARSVRRILDGLGTRDLERIESLLFALERENGVVRGNPSTHRLTLDAAVLGNVAFAYSRKHREVLATRLVREAVRGAGALPELASRVDALFPVRRPPILWRVGPEFGSDRNAALLLERRDAFLMRMMYRGRAARLARTALLWKEVSDRTGRTAWIGESCDDGRYAHPVRTLVLRRRKGALDGFEDGIVLTNLFNTPWEEIFRLYDNRMGRLAAGLEPAGASRPGRLAVAALVFMLLTMRNLRTWAAAGGSSGGSKATAHSQAREPVAQVSLLESSHQAKVLARMAQVVEYLRDQTERSDEGAVAPRLSPGGYGVTASAGAIHAFDAGTVVYVGGGPEAGYVVVVQHADGLSTTYGGLTSIPAGIRTGVQIAAQQEIGTASSGGAYEFEVRMSRKFIEKGFEPSVAEVLSPGENVLLDPIGSIVGLQVASARQEPRGSLTSPPPAPTEGAPARVQGSGGGASRGWVLGDVAVFVLSVPGSMPTAFVANATLEDDERRREQLDEDPLPVGLRDFTDLS